MAPFLVERDGDGWTLIMRPRYRIIWCPTIGECVDYAYRNWPWWP